MRPIARSALPVAMLAACSAASTHPPAAHTPVGAPASAPSRTSAPAADAPVSAPPVDFEREWAWITSEFPGAGRYRPAGHTASLVAELLAWVPAGETVRV